MSAISFPSFSRLKQWPVIVLIVVLTVLALAVRAQVSGDRGIAPVAASRDIEVKGIEVDTSGKTPEQAREEGWKEATRKAWAKINGPKLSDSQLSGLVSAIAIEHEQLGPHRYIARLGIVFDRGRAAQYLGGSGEIARSSPMLLIPVTVTAGTETVYQRRNPWQRAWAEYQAGESRIDYVRPVGAGGDSLLVTFGQTGRRSRLWWRSVLDQFGAADVLVAIARLDYSYPGGPVTGHFTARYGPDNNFLGSFELTAQSPDQLPTMLAQAVQRFDEIFTQALSAGKLRPDRSLDIANPTLPPAIAALVAQGRALEARDAAAAEAAIPGGELPPPETGNPANPAPEPTASPAPVAAANFNVQFASPNAAAVDSTLAAVRGADGVRAASTSSLALGGISVMRVSFVGTQSQLGAALRARGLTVRESAGGLIIGR